MSQPVGIIYPPNDLRDIVDKTADYVARKGKVFEEMIKREQRNNPKFSFLLIDDPFNAYYQYKVKDIKQLKLETEAKSKVSDGNQQDQDQKSNEQQQHADQQRQHQQEDPRLQNQEESKEQQCQDVENNRQQHHEKQEESTTVDGNGPGPRVRMKLNEYIQEMTMKLEEPPTLNYLATSAPNLTHQECEIIKLTAKFVALHGRSFLLELVSREQNNSEFDFLKPQHGQFSYMSNLIMQYALVQNYPLDMQEQLAKDATSQKCVLDKIKMRAEWNRMLELEQKKKEETEEKEKLLYSQIDWHDFVIVETIDFYPDEIGAFSPTTADQVGTRLLLQQRTEEQTAPVEMEIDMDMDSDQELDDGVDEDEQAREEQYETAQKDYLPPQYDEVVIRKDYDPKKAAAAAAKSSQPDSYFVSQITNERVPIDKIHEHIKYNLSDPRYLEKKEKMLQERRNEDVVFASGSQIQNSLKSLAERRTDIFGMNDKETAIGRRIGEEEQEPTKDDRLIWDGHKSSLKKKKLN